MSNTTHAALVTEWPSIDAGTGQLFSKWEQDVTAELMQAADYQPTLITKAYPAYVRKWDTLFTDKKFTPTQATLKAREKLCAELVGYDAALTLGSHAMWALTGETKLDVYRGTHIDSPFVPGLQVVPTYSPYVYARVAWNERPIVVSTMAKARERYVDPVREIYVPETTVDLHEYEQKFIHDEIVFDVETCYGGRITEFSLAPTPYSCLYVQLETPERRSVWSEQDELQIWLWLNNLARRREVSWGFHNATYDLSYLEAYGIRPLGHIFDTMLRHHAFQPEWEKSLGFLAGLHLPTRAWKHLRTKPKSEFNKADAL